MRGWLAALVLAIFAFPGTASADFTFDLDTGNSNSLGSGPYATVSVVVNSPTSATVTFTAYSGYAFVDGSSLALNVADGVTASNAQITSSTTSPAETLTTTGKTQQVDGFGKFNVVYDQANSSNPAFVETVDLTGTGFSETDLSTILVANENGAVAAAHIFVVGSNGITGYAAGSGGGTPPVSVPEPSTMALLLSGLIGGGFYGLRRFRRPQLAAA